MSGGHFEYKQYYIDDIVTDVERYVYGQELDDDYDVDYHIKECGWYTEEQKTWIRKHKRTLPNVSEFDDDTIALFKEGIRKLKEAEIYAQRIDWLLSGDDGEDDFKERLSRDLLELQAEHIKNKDKGVPSKLDTDYAIDRAIEACKMPIEDDKDSFKCRLATIINYLEHIKLNNYDTIRSIEK